MRDIVVEVKRGTVMGLYCDIEDARFVVVDWDVLESGYADDEVIGIEQDHSNFRSLPARTRKEYQRAISA